LTGASRATPLKL